MKTKIYFTGIYTPIFGTDGAGGMDIRNNTTNPGSVFDPLTGVYFDEKDYKDLYIRPNTVVKMDTKLYLEIPKDHLGIMAIRSSYGIRGLDLHFSTPFIDHDYRGQVGVFIENKSNKVIKIPAGERVAQLAVVPIVKNYEFVKELSDLSITDRGEKGFGNGSRHLDAE